MQLNELAGKKIPHGGRKPLALNLLSRIQEGGVTEQMLLSEVGEGNKNTLYGLFSYLNTRGLVAYEALIAAGQNEAAENAQSFPMKDENGVYFLGTYQDFKEKKKGKKDKNAPVVLTKEQMAERAQKRWDKAHKTAILCRKRAEDNPRDFITVLRFEIADKTLALATALNDAVKAGVYRYERGSVAED